MPKFMVHAICVVLTLLMFGSPNGGQACEGDLNCSGTVDGADLAIFANSFGSTGCSTCTRINMDDYLVGSGVIKVFQRNNYVNGQLVSQYEFTETWNANESTWTYPDGSRYVETYVSGTYGSHIFSSQRYDSSNVLEYTETYDPPLPTLSITGETIVGQTWGDGAICTKGDYSAPQIRLYTLLGVENVTVPAGTFQECVKIHRASSGPSATYQRIYWVAKGMGVIKRISFSTDAANSYTFGDTLELMPE